MVMRNKSSEEILTKIKEEHELKKRLKYEEFLQKYFYRQILTSEKQNEMKNKFKDKAKESQLRHQQAAERRKTLLDNKKNKILARKQSRSGSRDSKSGSISELISTAKPGVYFTKVLSTNDLKGTAGFGRGVALKPVNTSVYDGKSTWRRSVSAPSNPKCGSFSKSDDVTGLSDSQLTKTDSLIWLNICEEQSKADSVKEESGDGKPEKKYVVPEFQLKRFIEDSRKYHAMKDEKKVSFKGNKLEDQKHTKPTIKKSLCIDTPETKRAILMKMSEVGAKQKTVSSPRIETTVPQNVPTSNINLQITKELESEINIEGKGDSLPNQKRYHKRPKNLQPTVTEPDTPKPPDLLENTKEEIDKTLFHCGRLLETREHEKKSRKLKLFQLHEDLKNIEEETKRLSDKNALVSQKLLSKSNGYKENLISNLEKKNNLLKTIASNSNGVPPRKVKEGSSDQRPDSKRSVRKLHQQNESISDLSELSKEVSSSRKEKIKIRL